MGGTDRNQLRQRLSQFFEMAARPDRYVAVVVYNNGMRVLQPFTTNAALLKNCLDSIIESVALAAPVAAPAATTSRSGMTPASAGQGDIIDARRFLESVPEVADALGGIRGRKVMLLYTGARNYNRETSIYVDAAAAALNKANVAVYGVTPDPSFANTLAGPTGGDIIRVPYDTPDALAKVVGEQEASYELVFTPGESGSACHKVQVKLAPGGVDARFGKQFCWTAGDNPLAGQPAAQDLEARAAGSAPGSIAVGLNLPFFYNGPNRARVSVAATLALGGLKFKKEKGRLAGELNVVGIATKEDGSRGPRFSDVVKLAFDTQQQADAFIAAPYHYEKQLEFPAGRYVVRVAFGSAGEFGRAEAPLAIDPWTPTQFAVSGIALGAPRRAASSGLIAGVPPALLEGLVPLAFREAQVAPIGVKAFSASDKIPTVVYTEIHAPGGDPKQAANVTFKIRVVDVKSGQSKFEAGPVNAARYVVGENPVVPVVFDLPVKQVSPGSYRLEFSAQAGGNTATRSVEYEVK
jgi:hypothetical protein